MQRPNMYISCAFAIAAILIAPVVTAEDSASTETEPNRPALPEGMTLDEVFGFSESPTPEYFPPPVNDDALYTFVLLDQLEYRLQEHGENHLGWEAQAWAGYDFERLWLKAEGEAAFENSDEGESENDLVYGQLITPFWYAQIGVQYANEWDGSNYDDRWSGVVALQGMAPGMFEVDGSLYLSEDGDVTASLEAEYDLRITQRLVLQPRMELGFAAQDIPERNIGAGLTGGDLDLRLRYEFTRKFAPYVGVRYGFSAGETADFVEAAGGDRDNIFFVAGVRLAF